MAEYIAKRFRWKTIGIDEYTGHEQSFLDGRNIKTARHYRSPPTVHSYVQLYKSVPEIKAPIGFLCITSSTLLDELVPYFDQIVDGTIIVGKFELVKELGESADLRYRPAFFKDDFVAVQVVSP